MRWRALSAAALLALGTGLALPAEAAWPGEPPLDHRLHLAARYLHDQIGAEGKMVYRRHALTAEADAGRYNLLRHAGTLLALAEYHQEHPPDAVQQDRIGRSLSFLKHCCMRPSLPAADDLALWSDPELVGGRRSYPVAKLGGAGLALAAMAQWRHVRPDHVPLQDMQALARFILSMQAEDGRFQSLHALHSGQHDPQWESLYYPGEAALGLILLFEHDGDWRWLEAAVDALRALARQRETQADPPPDHWALLATGRLWQQEPQALEAALPAGFSWQPAPGKTALAPLLMGHALSVARFMLREQSSVQGPDCTKGSFTADGRTTPTATRLEGLLGLLPVLQGRQEQEAIARSVRDGMGFLLRAQRLDPPSMGSFSRTSPACPSDDRRAHEVRVDYVQHAMAALQAYRLWLRASAGAGAEAGPVPLGVDSVSMQGR